MNKGKLNHINVAFRKACGAVHQVKIPEPDKGFIEAQFGDLV
jgi:hypothetical protein